MNTDYQKGSRKATVPLSEKYLLTVSEAAAYFSIGLKKMRRMAEDNAGSFAILLGNRYLINRPRFEAYIDMLMRGEEDS